MKDFCMAILLLSSMNIWAQDTITTERPKENQFSLNANLFTRGEIRKGGLPFTETDEDLATFIVEQTLFGMDYKKEGLNVHITAQHSGTWGGTGGGTLNIYEAWTQLSSKKGLFAKVGRQNLSYDDQRIFGADNWAMTAMSHDALKIGFENKRHKIHLIGAFNQNPENINTGNYFTGGMQPYKALEAIWYHFDFPHLPIGASIIAANIGMQGQKDSVDITFQQQILGGFLSFKPKKWNIEASYYHQLGKEEHGIPIDAWMASIRTTFTPNQKHSFYAGYDYLSGDKNFSVPESGSIGLIHLEKIHGFSSVYGSHHKFYGAMDFFYVSTYYGGFTPGLQNLFAGWKWAPSKKISFDTSYHFLQTATSLPNAHKLLGNELEFAGKYSIRKEATLTLGYTFMRGTDTMKLLRRSRGDSELHWAWIMLSISPSLFSTSW